ncbi:glycosyltransferase family, helical bundle domain protein [Enterobacter hormaechei subsp. xiangfangensis]|nr:glycosyltransferase family, helical bundle domain protein [Enterobacter hormaechei subsp. xiangfangensis]
MDYRKIIKEVGRGKNHARDLDQETARALYTRMLNGDVPELEMGGILIALRIKGEGEAEMRGFYEAMQSQTMRLTPPVTKPMPIVIPPTMARVSRQTSRRCWLFCCRNSVSRWWCMA